MCFSPCFVQATRGAFVQRRLLQCRTCGSQAFHVIDCCRNPDYAPVATTQLAARLKGWLTRVRTLLRRPLLPRHQPVYRASPEELDTWETRPLATIEVSHAHQAASDDAEESAETMQQTIAASR